MKSQSKASVQGHGSSHRSPSDLPKVNDLSLICLVLFLTVFLFLSAVLWVFLIFPEYERVTYFLVFETQVHFVPHLQSLNYFWCEASWENKHLARWLSQRKGQGLLTVITGFLVISMGLQSRSHFYHILLSWNTWQGQRKCIRQRKEYNAHLGNCRSFGISPKCQVCLKYSTNGWANCGCGLITVGCILWLLNTYSFLWLWVSSSEKNKRHSLSEQCEKCGSLI